MSGNPPSLYILFLLLLLLVLSNTPLGKLKSAFNIAKEIVQRYLNAFGKTRPALLCLLLAHSRSFSLCYANLPRSHRHSSQDAGAGGEGPNNEL